MSPPTPVPPSPPAASPHERHLHVPPADDRPLLRVEDLAVSFDGGRGGRRPRLGTSGTQPGPRLRAVDSVRLSVFPGQTLAVVGESGCGKSVTALSLLQLVPRPPARFDRGRAVFQTDRGPRDLLTLTPSEIREVRGNEIAMIFQEPMSSLNPVFSIGDQITEAIRLHQRVSRADAANIAIDAMREVRIPDPGARLREYPHQFSGGMRQRVMIAMALACQPKLLLADEPTTALDVTVQAQILELLRDLQRRRAMAVMLITHDLGVVAQNADVVCVMYAGRVVEYAFVDELFARPLHPYTRALFNSIPTIASRKDRLRTIADHIDDTRGFEPLGDLRRGALARGQEREAGGAGGVGGARGVGGAGGAGGAGQEVGGQHGVRPWWPWHAAPEGLVATPTDLDADPTADYALVEVEPDHWVGAWRTPEAVTITPRFPELRPRTHEPR